MVMKIKRKILPILSVIVLLGSCYGQTMQVNATENLGKKAVSINTENNWKKQYKKLINNLHKQDHKYTYNLVYVNKDKIPELVVNHSDNYTVSLYTYGKGKVYTVIENWSYGMGGTVTYEYLPQKNVIRIQGSDITATWTENYFKIKKMELVEKRSLTTYQFKDKNHNGVMDQDEENTYSNKPVEYYKNGKKISKKEYEKFLIKGNYKNMIDQKTYQQILKQLK